MRNWVAGLCALLITLAMAVPASASDWKKAETRHFVIYSDGSTSQLEDYAVELEKFDALLRLVFGRPDSEAPTKLSIYLLRSVGQVEELSSPNIAGFYSSRTEGSFAVSNRESNERGLRTLFHEYAHHFMFNNFSIPAPAWFVEGFAEYVSTARFRSNGEWIFGYPQKDRAYSVNHGQKIPIETLLTSDASEVRDGGAFYGWSWALTHMLYSDPKKRGDQIQAYLREINGGTDNLEAARKNFGDLNELERNLRRYVRGSMGYSKSDLALPYSDEIRITDLSDYQGELIELTLERITNHELEATRDKLRELATRGEGSAESWYQLAEIEYALNHKEEAGYDFAAAHDAVDRALALNDSHIRANLLKARLLLEVFDHQDAPDQANWQAARDLIGKANRLAPDDPLALYEFANSYLREGTSHPQITAALERAFMLAPEAAELRFAYATQLAREGRYDDAIYLLKVLANNPHGDRGAKAVIESFIKMRDGDIAGDIRFVPADQVPGEDDGSDGAEERAE